MENKKKYNCECCKFKTNFPSEWLVHIKSKKHERQGQPKTYKCENCDYEGLNHWNLKMHILSQHATKEERQQQKYYCADCDQVFFSSAYKTKHINGINHKNRILADRYVDELNKK
jgi:hypothetical protein